MNRAIWLLFLSRVRKKKSDHFMHVLMWHVNRSWNWLIRRRPSEGTHNFISMDPTASKSPAVGSQKTMRCHSPWQTYWLILAALRESVWERGHVLKKGVLDRRWHTLLGVSVICIRSTLMFDCYSGKMHVMREMMCFFFTVSLLIRSSIYLCMFRPTQIAQWGERQRDWR